MPNVMKELKAEIARLARKEINKELVQVRRLLASHRGRIAELGRQLTSVQKEAANWKKVSATVAPVLVTPIQEGPEAQGRFWITSKGVKSLRKRLALTQIELGRLAEVTPQTIVNWEGAKGKVEIRRKDTVGKMRAIRAMSKKEAKAILYPPPKEIVAEA